MNAYVINVKSATERWKSVNKEFSKYNIIPNRIDAITKRGSLTNEEKLLVTKNCLKYCPHTGLAITFSHIDAWKKALSDIEINKNNGALICEDDVKLINFEKFDEYFKEVPSDYDIMYVGCLFCHDKLPIIPDVALSLLGKRKKPEYISEHIWVPPYVFGAHAYYVSEKGLRKLIELFSSDQIYDQIDVMLNNFAKENLIKVYAMKPLLAFQDSSLNASSQWNRIPAPRLANYVLDKFLIAPEVTIAYGLSYPLKRINEYEVNAWSFLFFFNGLIWGLLNFSPIWFPLSFAFDLVISDSNDKTLLNTSVNIFIYLIAYAIGLKLRALKK